MIEHPIHAVVTSVLVSILVDTKAGASPSTATLALVVPRQGIPARKLAAAFGAGVRPFTGVKFGMTLEVVQPAEARLTCWALVGFLLTVGEKMALKVVVAGEVRGAVGTLVTFCARRSRAVVISSHGHAEHAGGLPRVMFRGRRNREGLRSIIGESTIARLSSRISCGGRIDRAVGGRHASRPKQPGGCRVGGTSRCGWCGCAIQRAKARYTYWTRLHVLTGHRLWDLDVPRGLGNGFGEGCDGGGRVSHFAHLACTKKIVQRAYRGVGRDLAGHFARSLFVQVAALLCHRSRTRERLRRVARRELECRRLGRVGGGGRGQARIEGDLRRLRVAALEGVGANRLLDGRYGGWRIWSLRGGRERACVRGRGREGSCRCHRTGVTGRRGRALQRAGALGEGGSECESRGGAQGSKRSDDDATQNNCCPKTTPQTAVKRCACRRLHPSTESQNRKRTAMRAGDGRGACNAEAAQSTRLLALIAEVQLNACWLARGRRAQASSV